MIRKKKYILCNENYSYLNLTKVSFSRPDTKRIN